MVQAGFLHVGQAGLELLTSGDLPALASQSAGITGASHRFQPGNLVFILFYYLFFEMEFCSCCPDWSAMVRSWLAVTFASRGQAVLLLLPPQ